jgi:phosphatidylserine/phosphatidylglycerophosphate/cardiolipin synthase-like enzyme
LYDFTSKHILDHVTSVFFAGQEFTLTLDNPTLNPTADQSDPDTMKALSSGIGNSFRAAWALVRQNKDIAQWIYPTAYHIKVAVRDGESVWLSSGNWNNSNQPDMDPIDNPQSTDQQTARKSDRDWHVIVDDTRVSTIYEAYLKHDYAVASALAPATGPGILGLQAVEQMPAEFEVEAKAAWQFFKPLQITEMATITPLLTPDPGVYKVAMLDLINSANEKLYIQLQYIHPSDAAKDQGLTELIDAVAAKIEKKVDVRIIVSQWQLSHGWLEKLQTAGIDLSCVKVQNGVHNKGFVIDSNKVALGSENWSGDGVLRNRDASVIIENNSAATYFEQIFLHDWNYVAQKKVNY